MHTRCEFAARRNIVKWPRGLQFRNSPVASRDSKLRSHIAMLRIYIREIAILWRRARVSRLPMEKRRIHWYGGRSYNLRMHTAERAKWKCQRALRANGSPVSRRTGERRTFWPCPKYCDWLTRTLVYLADHRWQRRCLQFQLYTARLSRVLVNLWLFVSVHHRASCRARKGRSWPELHKLQRAREIRLPNGREESQRNRKDGMHNILLRS